MAFIKLYADGFCALCGKDVSFKYSKEHHTYICCRKGHIQ